MRWRCQRLSPSDRKDSTFVGRGLLRRGVSRDELEQQVPVAPDAGADDAGEIAAIREDQIGLGRFETELDFSGHRYEAFFERRRRACEAALAAVVAKFGRVDVLVNNAGITQPIKTLDISPANYEAVTDVNLRGTLYMSQAALPAMLKQNSGSIVCISSVSAQRGGGIFGGPHYSAAKGGVLGLARAMAREFGPCR